MKAFLKRWPGTMGMVALVLLIGVVTGVGYLLEKVVGVSAAWASAPLIPLIFWMAWKTDRKLQEFRKEDESWRRKP